MIDGVLAPFVERVLRPVARRLAFVGADAVSVAGLVVGLAGSGLIAFGWFLSGLGLILASRLLDGLDGAVARINGATARGAFVDAAFDFVFYASVPLGFAVVDPGRNALAAAVLLFAFMGTASSFLAFAVVAGRGVSASFPRKGFYYLGGLTEAAETLGCFAVMCVFPGWFVWIAYGFAVACGVTTVMRWRFGWVRL